MNFETPLSCAIWAMDLAPVTCTESKLKFLNIRMSLRYPNEENLSTYLVSYSLPTRLYTTSECRRHSAVCCSFLTSHSYRVRKSKDTPIGRVEGPPRLAVRRTSGTI